MAMIGLYAHNRAAYEAAVAMLDETGKAAIIHPTGTGKSFTAFKLCEDHPDKTVCWLSPSAYIFQTQKENLTASGSDVPKNILFFTYARLINLTEEELLTICPDYIILDEFHRCGAEMWGMGVQRLLKCYPKAAVLGLSATNIRYLDNQRDMAAELFDGNVASEISLGEAIVRGILHAPRYVLSIYSYQKDLLSYERKVRNTKNPAVRAKAEQYLEALRRELQQAEGLDEVFGKQIQDRYGKYIVFCSNAEHMAQMQEKMPEWFSKVDEDPHVYSAYSSDPETSEAFAQFKRDQSHHLKLLFCIDMLNEGIHLDDISGVILLRPTVSPIVYKQQIGRALSARRKRDTVIFDVVLNIENLYSIGAIEEEMQLAMTYYRSQGREDLIRQEHFQIIDEVRDCRELFAALNDTLTASWDLMYQKAKEYYEANHHLEIPKRYRTAEGYSLGQWLLTQRKVRAGEVYGRLGAERIAKLDAIGMVWDSYRDLSWNRNYQAAQKYFQIHGNLNVPAGYETADRVRLGSWISNLRTYRKNQAQQYYLSPERIRALDDIGMTWNVSDQLWQQYYAACLEYFREHHDLEVPLSYVTDGGVRLGTWIHAVRSACRNPEKRKRLSEEQIQALKELGMTWRKKSDVQWERGYAAAAAYHKTFGNLKVPTTYQTSDGFRLGRWLCRQRERQDMPAAQQAKLDRLGMIWKKADPWEERLTLAQSYYHRYGNLEIPADYVENGIWLGKWLDQQRQIYIGKQHGKVMSKEQIRALEQIGMCWTGKQERVWQEQYAQARQYFETYGSLRVPANYIASNGKRLDLWIRKQKKAQKDGKLSAEQVQSLKQIGF